MALMCCVDANAKGGSAMTRGQGVAETIEHAVAGPVWHGPALTDHIGDVNAELAAQHPITGAHSIWELVVHLTAWAEIVRQRLRSREPIEATDAQDWPAIPDRSPDAWRSAVARAMGGKDRVLAVRTIVVEGRGDNYNLGQNLTPEAELPRFEVTAFRRANDYANKRWRIEQTREPRFPTGNTAPQQQRFGVD